MRANPRWCYTAAAVLAVVVLAACNADVAEPATPLTETNEPAAPETPAEIGERVAVSGGMVTGIVGADGLKQYHGIPYAAPPVGDLRWAPPAPVVSWNGSRDATAPGPACMQLQDDSGSFYGRAGFAMDEDCLTLNVWTRAQHVGEGLPVMVWVHGGALVTGSGDMYPGELLTAKGVVLVTVNYRLGRFGFLAHPALTAEQGGAASGNQGIRDQIAALRWVRDNIASFGGDAGNVTIFGESAGSLSMSLLQASPLARGLFHRVIGQSGGAFGAMQHRADPPASMAESPEALGERFGAALAGEAGDASLAGIRAIPAMQVLEVSNSDPAFTNYDSLAIVDGEVLPDDVATLFGSGQQADVPVLIGSNADEGSAFLPYFTPLWGEGKAGFEAYVAGSLPAVQGELHAEQTALYPAGSDAEATESWQHLFSDQLFTWPMRAWARGMGNVSSDAYLYWFTWEPPIPERQAELGAFHAAELGYLFGNLDLFGAVPTDADRQFSDLMASIWTQFAKTGNPNGNGLPEWPPYALDTDAYMELGIETGAKRGLRTEQIALFDRVVARPQTAQ